VHVLLGKYPLIFYSNFQECLFVLNGVPPARGAALCRHRLRPSVRLTHTLYAYALVSLCLCASRTAGGSGLGDGAPDDGCGCGRVCTVCGHHARRCRVRLSGHLVLASPLVRVDRGGGAARPRDGRMARLRHGIYAFLVGRMTEEHKFQLLGRLATEVLGPAAEGVLDVREEKMAQLVADTLVVLASKVGRLASSW
jgi:hypothetical protein